MIQKNDKTTLSLERIWLFYTSAFYLFWISSLKIKWGFALQIIKYSQLGVVLVLTLFFLQEKMTLKRFVIKIAFLFFFFLVELRIMNMEFLCTVMFILNADKIDFKRLLKKDYINKLVWLFIIIVLCWLGIVDNIGGVYYDGSYKMSLGFQHPNTLAAFVVAIVLEWYCTVEKMRFYHIAVGLFSLTCIYFITVSKTSCYIFFVILCLFALTKIFPNLASIRLKNLVGAILPTFLMCLSVELTKLYMSGSEIGRQLNRMLSGRLNLQALYWNRFDVTLFGADISWKDYVLDSAYIRCLLQYGLIFSIFLCVSYGMMLYILLKQNRFKLAFLVLFFVIYGFSETSMMRFPINITLILLIYYFGILDTLLKKYGLFNKMYKGKRIRFKSKR